MIVPSTVVLKIVNDHYQNDLIGENPDPYGYIQDEREESPELLPSILPGSA
eukprot:UN14984